MSTQLPQPNIEVASRNTTEELFPPDKRSFQDFNFALTKIRRLNTEWADLISRFERNRKIRKFIADQEAMRKDKVIAQDEYYIAIRQVEINIAREKPLYQSFLKQSRRVAIFSPADRTDLDPTLLEDEFTREVQQPGWDMDHVRAVDGTLLHGFTHFELEFDETHPLNIVPSYIPVDELRFPREIKDIQEAEFCVRVKDVSISSLRDLVTDFGFNKEESEKVMTAASEKNSLVTLYKLFFKDPDGFVYVAWLAENTSQWLKSPQKLYIGRDEITTTQVRVDSVQINEQGDSLPLPPQESTETETTPIFETEYPIITFPYEVIEDAKIVESEGRARKDSSFQDAESNLMSTYVNGAARSAHLQASPKDPNGLSSAAPKQLPTTIRNGQIWDTPMTFANLPAPSNSILDAIRLNSSMNSESTNQINFLVNNRKDSRKTATEVDQASQQNSLINSAGVANYSTTLQLLWTRVWQVVQSRAISGKIRFLPIFDANTGEYIGNDIEMISQKWVIKPAGDVDVIERQEQLMQMRNDLGVMLQSSAATIFLADYLKISYPTQGQKYIQALQEGNDKKNVIQALMMLLDNFASPEEFNALPPEEKERVTSIKEQAQLILQQP